MTPTNDPHDDQLRASLHALRNVGERQAPSFAQTWRAAKARQQTAAPSWHLAWAVAAIAALALVALIILPRQPKPFATAHPTPAPAATANHESPAATGAPAGSDERLPTDFLLTTNRDDSVDRVASQIDALLRP